MVTDDGTNYLAAPNITPDKETGAGTWPDDALARSIREGVGHDGRALASPMRSQDYRGLSDEDVKAIVVYLRTLTPVKNKLPARKLSNATGKAAVRKAAPLTSPVPPPDLKNPVDRGRYLAAAGECAGCHTAWYHRNPGLFGGGDEMYYNDEKKRGKVFSANISSHATGVGTWPVEVRGGPRKSGQELSYDCGGRGWVVNQTDRHIMKAKRRRHEAAFKARVALEAMKGIKTVQQIAKEFEIHPVQVSEWKKAMTQGAAGVFGGEQTKARGEEFDKEREKLHSKIGQLTVELDFLQKKSKQLGL